MSYDSINGYLFEENGMFSSLHFPLPSADNLLYEEQDQLKVPSITYQQGTSQTIKSDASQKKNNQKRISNNSFKVPLTIYKKALAICATKEHQIEQVEQVTKKKNMSVFPKLLYLSEQWQLKDEVSEKWKSLCKKELDLSKKGTRLEREIKKIFNRMGQALECKGWKKAIRVYWGDDVRHKKKLQRCIGEVEKFRKQEIDRKY